MDSSARYKVMELELLETQVKKMTGGTPEVRSFKINLNNFLHYTFDLIDF